MESVIDAVDKYAILLNDVYVDPDIFIAFSVILLALFCIRYIVLTNIETNKLKNDCPHSYVFCHICIELFIAYLICYFIIKLTSANPGSYIVNYIIAPMSGFLIGIFVDDKIFIPLESNTNFGTYTKKVFRQSNDSSSNQVNININQQVAEQNEIVPIDAQSPHLDKNIVDSDNFGLIVINTINEMKVIQHSQAKIIESNSKKLDESVIILTRLKETEMNDKKVELKRMIYNCLNNGYATPAENDKITLFYNSYRSLDGNGDIKSLYENHYLKLEVHEDRRKGYIPPVGGYLEENPRCEYGKYDKQ